MKIKKIGKPCIVMSNFTSNHNYFGWPSVAKLQNGEIAVCASGFRVAHACPFGKMVMSISSDGGNTYSLPTPVIDTVLDDRDGGICTFGENGVLVTSFNWAIDGLRHHAKDDKYKHAYLDTISAEQENDALGSTFRISHDGGVTFGEIFKSPITSPHGPTELSDGTILYIGRDFHRINYQTPDNGFLKAYKLNPNDGSMEYISTIESPWTDKGCWSYEPHAIGLPDGKIICQFRVESTMFMGENQQVSRVFTIFQTESFDNAKTWTKPHQIVGDSEGSPPHLFLHSSGTLICTYGYRNAPYGVKVMFSKDGGENWSQSELLYDNNSVSADIGYPATAELDDGSLLTVFYAHRTGYEPAIIMQQKWSFEE